MPTLEWIGKRAVLNHHREIPLRLLEADAGLSAGEQDSGNLLVQGDNLLALKALLPYYAGQVKCIYIDPPYNTGNENWVYNDAVNSAEIAEWLGRVVGGESEDLSRHDKWLCMMYPRLQLLKQFLRDDGVVFVSIDDNEVHRLRSLMDEVFGSGNFVASVIWQKRTSPDARLSLGAAHDYIVVYAKHLDDLKPTLKKIPLSESRASEYKNPDQDPRGPWASVDLTGQAGHATPDQFYTIVAPSGKTHSPKRGRCWALAERTFKELVADKRIWFGKDSNARPRLKRFLSEVEGGTVWTWWPNDEVGHNQEATKELASILGSGVFETPKPLRLISRILQLATDRDSLVLDSFAGSGTTGHAVLDVNHRDGGRRRFILVEMDAKIASDVAAARLRRVIKGYTPFGGPEDANAVPPLGGGFRFCRLAQPLFDETGGIRAGVTFDELAAHVYFAETGTPWSNATETRSPLLGVHHGQGLYLLFNGVLGDRRPNGGNVLTPEVLASLPPHDGPKIIYGEGCRLGEVRLARERVTFRQIPYQLAGR